MFVFRFRGSHVVSLVFAVDVLNIINMQIGFLHSLKSYCLQAPESKCIKSDVLYERKISCCFAVLLCSSRTYLICIARLVQGGRFFSH
jgi:hypothetical protein